MRYTLCYLGEHLMSRCKLPAPTCRQVCHGVLRRCKAQRAQRTQDLAQRPRPHLLTVVVDVIHDSHHDVIPGIPCKKKGWHRQCASSLEYYTLAFARTAAASAATNNITALLPRPRKIH